MDDKLNTLAGGQYFSTLDVKCGYWQGLLYPENKEETIFPTG